MFYLSTLPPPLLHAPHFLYLSDIYPPMCQRIFYVFTFVVIFGRGFSVPLPTFICSISRKFFVSFSLHRYTFFPTYSALHSTPLYSTPRCLPAYSVFCVCFCSIVTMVKYTLFPSRPPSCPVVQAAHLRPPLRLRRVVMTG